jgi:hypothetical protein
MPRSPPWGLPLHVKQLEKLPRCPWEWWDCRPEKMNVRYLDFKSKKTQDGTWLFKTNKTLHVWCLPWHQQLYSCTIFHGIEGLQAMLRLGQHEKTIWALLGTPYLEDVPCIYSALAELMGMWSWENTWYMSSQTGAWKFCRLCDAIKHGCRCSFFQQRISWKCWMADKLTRFEETNRSHLDSGHPASGCGVLLCLLGIVTCPLQTVKDPKVQHLSSSSQVLWHAPQKLILQNAIVKLDVRWGYNLWQWNLHKKIVGRHEWWQIVAIKPMWITGPW